MAAINGNNYANSIAVPRVQGLAGEINGVKRVLLDQYTGTPIAADVLSIGRIPKGARILELKNIGCGTSPTFNVAAGAILSAETIVTVTIGATPAANPIAWVEYVID